MSDEQTVISYLVFLRKRIKRASKEDLIRWIMVESKDRYAIQMLQARSLIQLQNYLLDRLAEGEWDGPGATRPQVKGGG